MEKTNKKTPKQLERYFKGAANRRRIEIILLVSKNEGISLEGIAKATKGNFKTISEHTKKLVQAGLVNKQYRGLRVEHRLSPYGSRFLKFMESF
jgi:predicted transcriptional regulator